MKWRFILKWWRNTLNYTKIFGNEQTYYDILIIVLVSFDGDHNLTGNIIRKF